MANLNLLMSPPLLLHECGAEAGGRMTSVHMETSHHSSQANMRRCGVPLQSARLKPLMKFEVFMATLLLFFAHTMHYIIDIVNFLPPFFTPRPARFSPLTCSQSCGEK